MVLFSIMHLLGGKGSSCSPGNSAKASVREALSGIDGNLVLVMWRKGSAIPPLASPAAPSRDFASRSKRVNSLPCASREWQSMLCSSVKARRLSLGFSLYWRTNSLWFEDDSEKQKWSVNVQVQIRWALPNFHFQYYIRTKYRPIKFYDCLRELQ